MFKSLSSRSTRSASVSSGTSLLSSTTPSSATFLGPSLPPIPPTPTRDVPTICVVAPTPGHGNANSPIVEKRRARTLVPRRSALEKENGPQGEPLRGGSLRTLRPKQAPAVQEPIDPSTQVADLVARQFVASHQQRQFHSVGPGHAFSFVPAPRNPSPPSRQTSYRIKPSKGSKRVLVESRAYPGGGQVEVVKETIGRSSKPILAIGSEVLGSIRGGTLTRGSSRITKKETVRASVGESVRGGVEDENAGTAFVVKKKKSRGALDSIRWALGDRTNMARKAEKEKEKMEKAMEKERKSQDSNSDRPKMKLTIDTRATPAEVSHIPSETPSTSSALSPVSEMETPATTVASGSDAEAFPSVRGEKSKWRWTIGRKRAKSPGPDFERPKHSRTMSLDVDTLLATIHPEEPDEGIQAYATYAHRTASLDLPSLMNVAATETQPEDPYPTSPPLSRPLPVPVEIAPVEFGEPKTIRKGSTGSAESQAATGTMRRSSVANLISSGENASNTGSLALRAMRSVRSLARLGGWAKGDDGDKGKEKEGTVKGGKKKRRKLPMFDSEPTTSSGESWEAGALGQDPTITVTASIGQPIHPGLQLKNSRDELREGSGSTSRAAPSTISFGKNPRARTSNGSSGSSEYAASSACELSSIASSSIRHQAGTSRLRCSSGMDYDSLFSVDSAQTGVESGTMKQSTRRAQDPTRSTPKSLMGLFEVPSEVPPEASPPHVEVRGVKVGKGRVRERVREFEARAEENIASQSHFGTVRSATLSRHTGMAAVSHEPEVESRRESYAQDRRYALSLGRSASVPLLNQSPRPAQSRPKSEHLLWERPEEDVASISMINAANSDLSDLISRLDLSMSPDSKYHLSPPPSIGPASVYGSPSKSSPRRRLTNQPSLTSLVGYNHPSLKSTPSLAQSLMLGERNAGKSSLASMFTLGSGAGIPDVFSEGPAAALPAPSIESQSLRGHKRTRSRGTSSQATPRIAPEARHRAGTRGTLGEMSMLVAESEGPDSDIPDELQVILAGQSESEGGFISSDLSEPQSARVQFRVPAEYSDETEATGSEGEEVCSRKSFDFTGELGQLKGGSRNSFVEALVTAFAAPPLPAAGEGQLQLNLDAYTNMPDAAADDNGHDEGRTPTFMRIPRAINDSNGQLNLDFRFDAPSHGPRETEMPDPHQLPPREATASIPSMSSLGRPMSTGEPFDYETLMRELDEVSSSVDDSAQGNERAAARRRNRLSSDSDRSFHFRGGRNHRQDATFAFAAPPVSFHNRPYGRQFGHTLEAGSSSRSSRSRDYSEHSGDSDDSAPSMARPGLGEKMFQMGTEHGMPLPSIMASPANSDDSAEQQFTQADYADLRSLAADRRQSYISDRRNSFAPSLTDQHRMSFMSYDSYLEVPGNGHRTSIDTDSLFERRGRPSSISSVSVFGDDRRRRRSRAIYNPSQFRPVSIISMQSETTGEDDTMVSMIGGGDSSRVPRKSIGTTLLLDTSPCMRAEKRAKEFARAQAIEANRAASLSALTGEPINRVQAGSSRESVFEYSPSRGRSCIPSRPFARPRPPANGKSTAEDSDSEDVSSGKTPMRSSTWSLEMSDPRYLSVENLTSVSKRTSGLICTAEPPDTPPLSDASSISGGSQSGIDVSQLMDKLGDASASVNGPPSGRRARPKGHGHRRSAQISRSSVALSISEDDLPRGASAFDSSTSDSVIIINPDAQMAEMLEMISHGYEVSNEQMALVTRYCALRNEAMETVALSQKIWQDTDFSRFSLSTFTPPTNPEEIKAMIDHSQGTYGELPAEAYRRPRLRHSRPYPRTSPYPADVSRRSLKSSVSPRTRMATEGVEQALSLLPHMRSPRSVQASPMASYAGMGLLSPAHRVPASSTLAPLSPLVVNVRSPSVTEEKSSKYGRLGVRRGPLGWGRKKPADENSANGKAHASQVAAPTAAKENEGVGAVSNTNNSLRFNRPRPKGRVASGTSRPTLRV